MPSAGRTTSSALQRDTASAMHISPPHPLYQEVAQPAAAAGVQAETAEAGSRGTLTSGVSLADEIYEANWSGVTGSSRNGHVGGGLATVPQPVPFDMFSKAPVNEVRC